MAVEIHDPQVGAGVYFAPNSEAQLAFLQSKAPELLYSSAYGKGKSTRGDTRIWLHSGGLRQIKDVRPGDMVLALDTNTHRFVPRRVLALVDSGVKEGYRVRLRGGDEIVVSAEHPFYAVSGVKVMPSNSAPCGRERQPTGYAWQRTAELKPGAFIAVPQTVPRRPTGDDCSVNNYELMGYLLGDGHFREDGGVNITSTYASVVSHLNSLLPPNVMLSGSRDYRISKRPGVTGKNPVGAMVDRWGLRHKRAAEKFIPEFAFTSSDAAIAALVSGLLATDGWVDAQCLGYASTSEPLALGLRHALRLLGIYSRYHVKCGTYKGQPYESFVVSVNRAEDLTRATEVLRLGDKHQRLMKLLAAKLAQKPTRGVNKIYREGDVAFRQIAAIEPTGPCQMYDLAIEGTHNFIGNGFVLHNSRVLCEKADLLARTFPKSFIVIARKQRAHMGATTLQTLLNEVITPSHRDWGWRPGADGGSLLYYPNESRILAVGLDNPGRARSAAFSAAFIDQAEEIDEEEWNAIAGRLRLMVGDYRQLAATCNPDDPSHFLFRKFRPDLGNHVTRSETELRLPNNRLIPKGAPKTETIVSGAADNLENLPEDYLARLYRMAGRYHERYVLGRWVSFEGMVYDNWDPSIHVVPRPKVWSELWGGYPPPDWPRYRGIDFGYVNPLVCQYWAKSPDAVWYMYREIYMTHRTVQEHARTIRAEEAKELMALRVGADGKPDMQAYCRSLYIALSVADHDAEDRATLDAEGIHSYPAIKDITPGIQTVYEMMQPIQHGDGSKTSNVRFLDDALVEPDQFLEHQSLPTKTIDEMGAYRFPRSRPQAEKGPREVPADRNNHGADCCRYVLHTAKISGDMTVRWL